MYWKVPTIEPFCVSGDGTVVDPSGAAVAGADVKDAQAPMRHSRSSTTLDIYQRFVPESQQRVVDKLNCDQV